MEALQFRQFTKTPLLTSTIHVFETGTTDLVAGLTKMDGTALPNPFTISQAGTAEDWGFKPADDGKSHIYDIYWNEEDVYLATKYLFSPFLPQALATTSSPAFAGLSVTAPGEINGKISGQSFTGFESQSDTVITFDDPTRVFTISPLDVSYNVWIRSVKFTLTEPQSIDIPDVEGLVIIIFDDNGTLEALTVPQFVARNPIPCLIAAYYWDAINKTTLGGAMEERHGCIMDSATHHYLHFTKGTQFRSGGTLTLNGDSSIAMTDVTCYDEDLELKATNSNAPSAPYEQILDHTINGYGMFPVIYRDGANGAWRKHPAQQFPWHEENSNLVYNQWTGAVWQQTELAQGWHAAYFIVMTNMSIEPVKIIMGQSVGQQLSTIQSLSTWEQLALDNVLSAEMKVLYRIIVKNLATPTVVEVQDLRALQNIPNGTYTANDHNALTGRTALNSHPAYAVGYTPVGTVAVSADLQTVIQELEAALGRDFKDVAAGETITVLKDTALLTSTQRSFTIDASGAPAGTKISYVGWTNDVITFTNNVDSGDQYGNTITVTVGANMCALEMLVYDGNGNVAIVGSALGSGSILVTSV